VRQFKPKLVALRDGSKADELRERLKGGEVPEIVVGDAGAVECAVHPDADAVVTGAPWGADSSPAVEHACSEASAQPLLAATASIATLPAPCMPDAAGRVDRETVASGWALNP
jgi:1-deoxy-D-xylulose 5-phosphate reductoisomerase